MAQLYDTRYSPSPPYTAEYVGELWALGHLLVTLVLPMRDILVRVEGRRFTGRALDRSADIREGLCSRRTYYFLTLCHVHVEQSPSPILPQ